LDQFGVPLRRNRKAHFQDPLGQPSESLVIGSGTKAAIERCDWPISRCLPFAPRGDLRSRTLIRRDQPTGEVIAAGTVTRPGNNAVTISDIDVWFKTKPM